MPLSFYTDVFIINTSSTTSLRYFCLSLQSRHRRTDCRSTQLSSTRRHQCFNY